LIQGEKEAVEKLKKGDLEAFDTIYNIYASKLHSFGYKYLKSETEAEELVQSVFIKLWEKRKKIDTELSFRSYLFTIAYNDICKLFRSRNYLREYVSETSATKSSSSSLTEEGTEYQSVLEEVNRIVESLPDNQKKAFIKSRFEGKTSKEIAVEMGLSPATVDNYVSAALKLIRSRLGSDSLIIILFVSLFLF
jgi:RNA polymerase sigma-70 factor (family 1)